VLPNRDRTPLALAAATQFGSSAKLSVFTKLDGASLDHAAWPLIWQAAPEPVFGNHPLEVAQVVGFKGERHKPSYRSATPLDARHLPTFN
jgi:hypothetical protein